MKNAKFTCGGFCKYKCRHIHAQMEIGKLDNGSINAETCPRPLKPFNCPVFEAPKQNPIPLSSCTIEIVKRIAEPPKDLCCP
jgi:hypothetical protein